MLDYKCEIYEMFTWDGLGNIGTSILSVRDMIIV